jgi:hypothetical protein
MAASPRLMNGSFLLQPMNVGKIILQHGTVALLLTLAANCQNMASAADHGSLPTISSGAPHIIPPAPDYKFPDGQTFIFSAEWHMFNAGTARVTLDRRGGQQHVTAIGSSAGMVNSLYKVHDDFEATFDGHTFCSNEINKRTEEGSHSRETEVRFDYERHKSVLDEKNLKTGELKHAENDIPECVTDMISGFYYLASLSLQPGGENSFQINDGGKTTEITAHVEGREQVKVPVGTFQTIRVRAEPVSGSLKGKGTIWAWYTDDANHIPVQMRSKLTFGTLMFKLQQIEIK